MYVASSHMYVCVTQALQCTCIDGDARMCSRAWMDVCTVWVAQWIACGVWTWCHRLPSVWIVTGWWMDVSHCRPSMDERTGLCENPSAMMLRLLESHHLVVPRHQLAVVLEALVLRVRLVAALVGVVVAAIAAVLAVLQIAREEVSVLVAQ